MLLKSKDNPKVKELAKLISSKKERSSSSSFAIEGIKLLSEAFLEHAEILSVFATADALGKYSEALSSVIGSRDFYEITDEISQKVTDAQTPQGVFAIVKSVQRGLSAIDNNDDKILVLNNIQDPGNLGTLLRTADAVGIDAAVLCENCCELYNPKVVRSTTGSIFRLKIICEDSFFAAADWLRKNGFVSFAAVVNEKAESLGSISFPMRCAAVIGNEGGGLKEEHISFCDRRITIKMKGNAESLNASAAAAIIMWEMTK